jgi:hypothetical protein
MHAVRVVMPLPQVRNGSGVLDAFLQTRYADCNAWKEKAVHDKAQETKTKDEQKETTANGSIVGKVRTSPG